jgi:hypothetical protein
MTKLVLTLACACTLLFALDGARAAEPDAGAKAGEAAKPGAGGAQDAVKPDEGGPDQGEEGKEAEEAPAGGEGGLVPVADLVEDGFVIRTMDFIPANAVTRQSGKVSSDAVIVTLQKSTSTAVCFYTLKAYGGKKLTTIAACNVHH